MTLSAGKKRLLRWLGYTAVGLAILLVVAGFFLGRYLRAAVDAERLEVLLNNALADATDGLYTASLEDIEWGLSGLSLRLTDLSLMLDEEVLVRKDAEGTTPEVLFQLQHATVDVNGVDPWALIQGEGFRALSITIDQPLIQLSGLQNLLSGVRGRGSGDETAAPPEASPREEVTAAAAPEPPAGPERRIRIWSIEVTDANLESYRRQMVETTEVRDTFAMFERFEAFDIGIYGVDIGGDHDRADSRLLFADDVRIDIDRYYYVWPDGLHEEAHGPISLSTSDGYLRVDNYSVTPTFERRDHVAEDGSAPQSREMTIEAIHLEGLDIDAILAGEGFHVEQFVIQNATRVVAADPPVAVDGPVDVTQPITAIRPGALITQALAGLPAIRVGRVLVDNLDITMLIDRDAGGWLGEPVVQHRFEDVRLDLEGYESLPGMVYDQNRPFLSDRTTASASGIVTTLGGGRYRLEMGEWNLDADERTMSVTDLRLAPLNDRRASVSASEQIADTYELTAAAVEFDEIDFGSLIDDVDVEVGELRLVSGAVRLIAAESDSAENTATGPDRLPRDVLGEIFSKLPNTSLESVQFVDWRVERWIDRTESGWLDEPRRSFVIDDLDLQLDEVLYSEAEGYDVERPLLAETGEASVARFDLALGDGYQTLSVTDIDLSESAHMLLLGGVSIDATDPDPGRLAAAVLQGSVPRITTGGIRLVGDFVSNLVQTGDIDLDLIELQRPEVLLLETRAVEPAEEGAPAQQNTRSLADLIDSLPIIRVGELSIVDAGYERRVGDPDHDWSTLPEPLERIGGLQFSLLGFDTDPDRPERRLMFSEGLSLAINDLLLGLGDGGTALQLDTLALSSDSDTLTVERASYSTRGDGGNNDFAIGRMELTNVPYGRTFRSLIDPPESGTPILSAIVDRDTRLRIDGVVGTLDDGRRTLEIGPIEGRSRDDVLTIDGVDFRPTLPDADPSTPETEYRVEQTLFSMDRVSLSGVDFPRLAAEGVFEARRLEVRAPSVAIVTGIDTPVPDDASAAAEDDGLTLADRIGDAIAGLPAIQIAELRLGDIRFEERRSLEGRPVRGFEEIQLAIDGLDVRADRDPVAAEGVLYADDIRIEVPQQRTWIDNVGYEIDFGPISLSTGGGTLDLGEIAYLPPKTVERYLTDTRTIESDRIEMHGRVGVSGIDFGRLLREEGVYATNMTIDGLNIHVLHDKKKPNRPRTTPPTHPHEAVQNLGLLFGIDHISLSDGAVRYSERDAEGDQPGQIWWDRLSGTINNLSNDPARTTFDTPTVLNVEARFLDRAFLRLDWRIPLLEPGPTMSYTAEIGPFEISRLTSILGPLEGVRITDGIADQAVIDIDIRDGRGTGTVSLLYRDLEIQLMDRNTGGRSLGQRIISFAANLIVPSNNRNRTGEPQRLGIVDYEYSELKPIFGLLWDAIKVGVVDLVT